MWIQKLLTKERLAKQTVLATCWLSRNRQPGKKKDRWKREKEIAQNLRTNPKIISRGINDRTRHFSSINVKKRSLQ